MIPIMLRLKDVNQVPLQHGSAKAMPSKTIESSLALCQKQLVRPPASLITAYLITFLCPSQHAGPNRHTELFRRLLINQQAFATNKHMSVRESQST
jgi:hypothetical protein